MVDPRIAQFLAQRGGLVAEALGEGAVRATHERRAQERGVPLDRYPDLLASDPREAAQFLEDVLVPETWFYRDITPFTWLTEQALQGRWRRPLRALSLPCASGEEACSLVIALREAGLPPGLIEVEGWDLSERALERARRGVYGSFSLRGVPPWLLGRYLAQEDGGVRVPAEILACVRFAQHNALSPPPSGLFDVIFCRNLLIYLEPEARHRVLSNLVERLTPEGCLILGHADGWPASSFRLRPVGPPGAFAHERAREPLRQPPSPPVPRAISPAPSPARPLAMPLPLPPRSPIDEARSLADQGQLEEAQRRCQAHIERHPLDPTGHRLLGVILVALQEPREAEASLRRALYLAPEDEECLAHLELLAERAGRTDQAAAFRRRRSATLSRERP